MVTSKFTGDRSPQIANGDITARLWCIIDINNMPLVVINP